MPSRRQHLHVSQVGWCDSLVVFRCLSPGTSTRCKVSGLDTLEGWIFAIKIKRCVLRWCSLTGKCPRSVSPESFCSADFSSLSPCVRRFSSLLKTCSRRSKYRNVTTLNMIRHGPVKEEAWYEAIGQDEMKRNYGNGTLF